MLDTTLCEKVCQWLAAGRWFSLVFSTNKNCRHDITELFLKVALNTITLTLEYRSCYKNCITNLNNLRISTNICVQITTDDVWIYNDLGYIFPFYYLMLCTILLICSISQNYDIPMDYIGDAPAGLTLQNDEKCPPLPEVLTSSACIATPCFSDSDCGDSEGRCCDNGCVFTCFSYPIGPTCRYNRVYICHNRNKSVCYLQWIELYLIFSFRWFKYNVRGLNIYFVSVSIFSRLDFGTVVFFFFNIF